MSKTMMNDKVILKNRPNPNVTEYLFELTKEKVMELQDGQFLVDVSYISIEPAMRGWISAIGNYSKPVPINGVMRSLGVGKIISSRNLSFKENEYVVGWLGWQKYSIVNETQIQTKVSTNSIPLSANLGVLGLNGITAFAGLIDKCNPKKGETIVVTTAAGSVGSAVGQIAKIYGCKTIGVTGSDEKVAICRDDFGYDEVINYKKVTDLSNEIQKLAPNGVDCFFDNVGGEQFDAVIENLNVNGRVVICGTSGMPSFPVPNGPRINRLLLVKRAKIEGLLSFDYFDKYQEISGQLLKWFKQGKLNNREDISYGIQTAPEALVRVLNGKNLGKQLVKL